MNFKNNEEERIFNRVVGSKMNLYLLSIIKNDENAALQLNYFANGGGVGHLINISQDDYASIKEILAKRLETKIKDDLELLLKLSEFTLWDRLTEEQFMKRKSAHEERY